MFGPKCKKILIGTPISEIKSLVFLRVLTFAASASRVLAA